MKKKIGSSKSMKKYGVGGQNGPGDGRDSIPSGAAIKAAFDRYKNSSYGKGGFGSEDKGSSQPKYPKPKTMEYRPDRDGGKPKTMEYRPDRDGGKMEYLKKGGSVSKMKKSTTAKSSKKKK